MEFLQPTGLGEALEAKRAYPDAVAICGGTDVMVELNFDRRRPERIIDLSRVGELAEWGSEDWTFEDRRGCHLHAADYGAGRAGRRRSTAPVRVRRRG